MAYRQMVTTDGHYNVPEIMRHAHRKAHVEFAGHKVVSEKYSLGCPSYAALFKQELANAWGWAFAIRRAGQGEAPARTVPMFRRAA